MDGSLPDGRPRRQDAEAALKLTSTADKRRFILENTSIARPPHVPEVSLHLAGEAHDLWLKTEEELEAIGLPPPFWAFAWAGGQGLARYILDNPVLVRSKTVLDLATGSGLVAIASGMAGASEVTANDIDTFCEAAVQLNAKTNKCRIIFTPANFLAMPDGLPGDHDVILAGDVFYDRVMADAFENLLRGAAQAGKTVLVGDPGRSYFPTVNMIKLAEYQVPVTRALEDKDVKCTRVWRVAG